MLMKLTHALAVKLVDKKDFKAERFTSEPVRCSLRLSQILQKPHFFIFYEC